MGKGTETDGARSVLTARVCLNGFVISLVLMLVLSLGGLLAFSPKFSPHLGRTWDTLFTLFYPADAALFGYNAIKQWKRYVAIESGAVIYASSGKSNPIELVLLLTALVAVWTYFILWLMQQIALSLWWLVLIVSDLVLLAVTLREWYRLLSRRPKAAVSVEPQESVWPPPPIRPDDTSRP